MSKRARRRWTRATLSATGAGCVIACAAWVFAGLGWVIDVAASFTFQAVVGSVVVTLIAALARARVGLALAALAVVVGCFGQVRGRTMLPGPAPAPDAPTLRVLVFNPYALNDQPEACFALIERADADVVVLIEPEIGFSRAIRWDFALEDAYPHLATRHWVRRTVSPIIVLSRLPMRAIDAADRHEPGDARFLLGVEVDAPWGVVAIAAGQPRSPRSAARWAAGNREAQLQAQWIAQLRGRRLPVIFCADLNATPAAHRGSIIRGAGVSPAKPLLAPAGTFPAALPWPGRIALDDAWHTPDLEVVSWATLGSAGSDHAAVLVEFARPR